jgi:lipoate-protein ligase B
MQNRFLGRVRFKDALEIQNLEFERILRGESAGCLFGFESDPTVTLGRRGQTSDLLRPREHWAARGFDVVEVDRGGQVTIHNPGQLVIFPVIPIAPRGPREFVCALSRATGQVTQALGKRAAWRESAPGLYTETGKIAALGLRFRRGVATHGLALNVRNDLAPFSWIVPCGAKGAPVDRLETKKSLAEIFELWVQSFTQLQVDKSAELLEF